MQIIIPAGGSGTRLWPLSRSEYPKHLLNLSGQGTMIQETVKRLTGLVQENQIFILTEKGHAKQIKQQLPGIPDENYIIEPLRRDTAAVIGLGALVARQRNPKQVLASLHADHIIAKVPEFIDLLKQAEKLASQHDVIVLLGVKPDFASTGFGYIQAGDKFVTQTVSTACQVASFQEKPDQETAERFLQAGNYYWNAGMFIARPEVLLHAYREQAPELYEGLQQIEAALDTPEQEDVIAKIYPTLPKIAIDIAIMEKISNIVVLPADIGWSDIGGFRELKDILPPNYGTNLVLGQHLGLDTEDCFVYTTGSKLVTTIGLSNMAVINVDDVVLVCPLDRTQEIRELVRKLKEEQRDKYL